MIAHCTAAALASENKVLCHPSSCDTIPTSANKEDHVSMGGYAARKALQVVDNVETILAIELLCACQGLNFLRPLKTSPQLEAVWSLVRSKVPEYKQDRYMKPDIDAVKELLSSGKIWSTVSSYMTQ
jgi:histidine ammonia-lyase